MEFKKEKTLSRDSRSGRFGSNGKAARAENEDEDSFELELLKTQEFLLSKIKEWFPVDKKQRGERRFIRERFISLFEEFIRTRYYTDEGDRCHEDVKKYFDDLVPRGRKQLCRQSRIRKQMDCEMDLRLRQKEVPMEGINRLGRFSEALIDFFKGQVKSGNFEGDFEIPEITVISERFGCEEGSDNFLDASEAFTWLFNENL